MFFTPGSACVSSGRVAPHIMGAVEVSTNEHGWVFLMMRRASTSGERAESHETYIADRALGIRTDS